MKEMYKKIRNMMAVCMFTTLLAGCALFDSEDKVVAEMDFTVIDSEELPQEIVEMIDEKKQKAFQMAYHDDTFSYIIVGYGTQQTTGYSIKVNKVYQGENGIWIDTDLIGPEKTDQVESKASYPYVIIKTEKTDQTMRFKN